MNLRWKRGIMGPYDRSRRSSSSITRISLAVFAALILTSSFPLINVDGKDTITLISPTGGENLTAGDPYYIKWETSGFYGYVTVSFTADGTWKDEEILGTVDNSGKGTKSYRWLIPLNLSSDDVMVKVRWYESLMPGSKPIATGRSEVFKVGPGVVLRFTEVPNEMSFGRYYTTSWDLWDPFGMVMSLSIQMRIDEGSGYGDWTAIPGDYGSVQPSRGWIYWTPPYYTEATIQLRISAIGIGLPPPLFARNLSHEIHLVSPSVTLLNFNGGRTLIGGETYTIEWMTSHDPEEVIAMVGVRYSLNNGGTWLSINATSVNDFEEDWTVPTSVDSEEVKFKIDLMDGEFGVFATDESSGLNRIISDPNTLTVSLLFPNPPVDQGYPFVSEEWARIEWEITGQVSAIKEYKLLYSNNSGGLWNLINTTSSTATHYDWKVPRDNTSEGKIRVQLYKEAGGMIHTENVHDFLVINDDDFNRPPVADAGDDIEAYEGDIIELDGSRSYDPDYDSKCWHWEQVNADVLDVDLSDNRSFNPHFSVELSCYPVELVFELTVIDNRPYEGYWPYNVDRVKVTVRPKPPVLNETTGPRQGWAGTWLKVGGEQLKGAEVVFKGHTLCEVPREPVIGNPTPDRWYVFRIPEGTPLGKGPLTVRNLEGECTTSWDFEVHPKPQWCYDWGLGYENPSKDWLSYPLDFWNDEGAYHDTFGNEVYIMAWVCIGIPYWSPWSGWGCWGEELRAPIAHDPIAALFYTCFYGWLADNGECFGADSAALAFYHEDLNPIECHPQGDNDIGEKTHTGALRRFIEYMHGSQISSEMINWYLREYIGGLIPSTSTTGMGKFLNDVRDAVDSEELGIISITEGVKGHAVVPYLVHDVDATHTRIYVYDNNRPGYSDPVTAAAWANSTNDDENHPPYIEIHKSGTYWDWHYVMAGGHDWGGPTGIAFVPYSKIAGDRTLPTSWEGLITVITGTSNCSVEDESGSSMGVDEDGNVHDGISGGMRLPLMQGEDTGVNAFVVGGGNSTVHINGTMEGTYNWTAIYNGTSAFGILDAEVQGGTEDTIEIVNEGGNPLRGRITYSTSDEKKDFSATHVKNMGAEGARNRTRVYSVYNATLFGDSEVVMNTTDDYCSLLIENRGPHTFNYDVEFLTNVISNEVKNRTGGNLSGLPRANLSDITIGPFQVHEIRPTDWLDLYNSSIMVFSNGTLIYPEEGPDDNQTGNDTDDDTPTDDDTVDDDTPTDDDTPVDDDTPGNQTDDDTDDDTTVDDDTSPDGDEPGDREVLWVFVIVGIVLLLLLLIFLFYVAGRRGKGKGGLKEE